MRVQLHSLQGAEHLNGRKGKILGLDADSGRLAVQLQLAVNGEGHSIKAKEANLLALPTRPQTAKALQELVGTAGDCCRVTIPTRQTFGIRAGQNGAPSHRQVVRAPLSGVCEC